MINDYRDLLLNLFLVFLPITLYANVIKADRTQLYNRAFTFVLFCAALILTMSFPVVINQSTFDFRAVPLAIGSLYGGVYVSILLYACLMVYRFILGSLNSVEYFFSIVPTFIAILWFIRKFPAFTLYQKIFSSVLVYFIIRVGSFITYSYLTNNLGSMARNTLIEIILFQCFVSGIFVYILEVFKKNSRLREEIMKSEKIKIVSEIAASVAHEVRNPLTSVRGFIQLMGKDDLSKENRRYYQKICLDELDRAQQIISDYLTFAKPDPEKIEEIHVAQEIDYVTNVLISYANYQNVQIIKQMPEEQLYILGDKFKLRQALINIGKNSIEAMPDGGHLTFTLRKINKYVLISIADTGVGMTAEQINRLGTPYYSTKDKGTGLGTMVSFSIIRKMHGKIEVTSEKGKGTTHEISLEMMV
ncbi:ATP-binding protein [Paenibacillus sedimenti]|uniref:histidine kinase n=1 Tax=Paenibacillus sedimenti TaxID=2770274 RepID=A0A926KU93_9BACL|nr:ATP-binding protein [Paenibacillus sedimenti]MBD0384244.1 sensor histidine kinase [Paenibacillus sedimenti]